MATLTKRERQDAKLTLADTDRRARNLIEPGRYIDVSADATQLPTRYAVGDNNTNNLVINPNISGLLPGRPWNSTTSVYAILAFEPKLVFDFTGNVFNTGGGISTFSNSITHARAGNATMTDADGLLKWAPHNLVEYSEDFTNSSWTKDNVSITANATTAPDGTLTADLITENSATGLHRVYNQITLVEGTRSCFFKYAGSTQWVYVVSGSNTASWVNIQTGVLGTIGAGTTTSVTDHGDGWYELSVYKDGASIYAIYNLANADGVTSYTGDGTSGAYIWGAHCHKSDLGGMVNNSATGNSYVPTTSSPVYLPRVGHHVYNGSAWANEGILHESEARTNLVTESNVFTTFGVSTVTADSGVSPTGETNAVLADTVSGSNNNGIGLPTYNVSAGASCTVSLYVKNVAGNGFLAFFFRSNNYNNQTKVWFNLNTGEKGTQGANGGTSSVSDFGITDVGNGWYRLFVVGADSSQTIFNTFIFSASSDISNIRDAAGEVLIFGAQVEASATPSSYIPTSGSTVTRAAETLTVPAANLPYPTPVEVTGTELVTNVGNPFTDTTGWSNFSNSPLTVSGGNLLGTPTTTAASRMDTPIPVVAGKVYQVTANAIQYSGAGPTFGVLTTRNGVLAAGSTATGVVGTNTKTFTATATTNYYVTFGSNISVVGVSDIISSVSVKEINPLALSIQMDGKMTYADDDNSALPNNQGTTGEAILYLWKSANDSHLNTTLVTRSVRAGEINFQQRSPTSGGTVLSGGSAYSPNVNVPFNIASRHGSTFINGSHEGTLLTADTSITSLPDLSSTDLNLGYDFMGTIGKFRVWSEDLTDAGIVEATEPSTEPSLQLTFDGLSTNSFTVLDWSE